MYTIVFLKKSEILLDGIKPKEVFATDIDGNIKTWENLEEVKAWKKKQESESRIIVLPYDTELHNGGVSKCRYELIYR